VDRPLRVATWNVHGCVGTDGRRDVARVADVIRGFDADLIGLQEVDSRRCPGQLAELARRTDTVAVAGPTMRTENGVFGNALLTRYPHAGVHHVDISVPRSEPRRILDVRVDLDGLSARVLVTHFGLSGRQRRRQADAVTNIVRAASDRTPVVLLGDFNEWRPLSRTLHRLDELFGPAASPRTFPSRLPVLALDRIWVRPHDAVIDTTTPRIGAAARASDHLPVLARIEPDRLARNARCIDPRP